MLVRGALLSVHSKETRRIDGGFHLLETTPSDRDQRPGAGLEVGLRLRHVEHLDGAVAAQLHLMKAALGVVSPTGSSCRHTGRVPAST
jgi:hypothetical protein